MANTLLDPLAVAETADVPQIGAPAAPAGDTAGVNPFDGRIIPEQTQAPVVAPVTPPATAQPDTTDPFAGRSIPEQPIAPSKGTATATAPAAGSVPDQVSGLLVPASKSVAVSSDTTDPFAGRQIPEIPAPTIQPLPAIQKPAAESTGITKAQPFDNVAAAKKAAVDTYKAGRDMLFQSVDDMANAIKVSVHQSANADINNAIALPSADKPTLQLSDEFTPEQLASAQRGDALIAASAVPELEIPVESFFAKTLLGKVLARSAQSAVAGAGYGLVAPNEKDAQGNDVSTWENMRSNAVAFAWQVPIFNGVFKLLGWPIGKALDATGIPQKVAEAFGRPGLTPEHVAKAASDVEEVLQNVRNEGANPADIPETQKADLVAMSIHNAVDQPDIASLDEKTMALNAEANKLPAMQEPREVADLPEPGPGEGQIRIAQGVYQNPDGTIEAYGYRGVSPVAEDFATGEFHPRGPTDPGLMGATFFGPNAVHSAAFGDLHYVGATFSNPLVIDDWHTTQTPAVEEQIRAFQDEQNRSGGNGVFVRGPNGEIQDVSWIPESHAAIITAARNLGHDGIIVRHGLEAVEIVSLNPSNMYSAGAADQIAARNAPTEMLNRQQNIQSKAARSQLFNGKSVIDLGQTNQVIPTDKIGLRNRMLEDLINRHSFEHFTYDRSAYDPVAGYYKINGRVFERIGHRDFQEVTGNIKEDPTIHPDIAKTAMLHDAISKSGAGADLVRELGPTNQDAARTLAGLEPNPVGYSTQSLGEKVVIQGASAIEKAGAGKIDEALLGLTAPQEFNENAHLSAEPMTFERLSRSQLKGEAALDGRIFAETVSEHIGNAKQMLSFEDPAEAAKRLRWAYEKNPIETNKFVMKDPALQKLEAGPEYAAQKKLARVKLSPNDQRTLRGYQQLLDAMRKSPKADIERVQSYITEVLEDARARAQGAPESGEDMVGMLTVAPTTQIRPPWSPVPPGVAVPQVPTDFAMLARTTEELRKGIVENTELPGVTKGPPPPIAGGLRSGLGGKSSGSNRTGAINPVLMFRILSGGSSGLLGIAAANTDDPNTRKWLKTAAGVLAFLALMPEKGGWFEKTKFSKALMRMNDLPAFMRSEVGIEAADKLRNATDLANYWQGTAKMRAMAHVKMFPTMAERETAARALDNPNNAAAWAKLTPEQQQFVGQEGIINHQMGQMLKAQGVIDNFRDDYIRHLWPEKIYNAWRAAKGSLAPSGFTKPREFKTFDDAEAWAKENNLPGPIIDIVQLQSRHFLEVGRALMNAQIQRDMKGLGLLIDRTRVINEGWRVPAVAGMHDMLAPDAVATALERLGNYRPGIFDSPFFKALDTIKGWQMRMVMAFPWIHGVNVARAALALDGTGAAYHRAMEAISAADPMVAQALKYGLPLFDRSDYAPKHAEGFQALLQNVSKGLPDALSNPTLGRAVQLLKSGETALWDKWVPALGFGSYTIDMHNWTERTGGQFAEGTPEFTAAARAAADRGALKMGKSLQMLKDPGLTYMLRNIFFAPQWMGSRIRFTAAALGEFREIASGQLPLQDAKLLPDKVRSLLIGATFTYIASMLWSGQPPKFNPTNSKFYIRTGVYDQNKREVGVDVAGWYADDIKLMSDPTKFFMNRLSPMLQVAHTAISGRDAFGRSIGGIELLDQASNEFGPTGSMADAAARALSGSGTTGANAIKGFLGSSDLGSSASLPNVSDLRLQGMAHRVLQKAGLPTDDDRIYELQQMIGSNVRNGKPALAGAVMTWLAYQRQSYERQFPKPAGIRYLFRSTQNVLRDLAR